MPDTIICPNCQTPIELTEVLSAQLRGQLRQEFEAEIHRREKALADREQKLSTERQAIEQATREIDQLVAEKLEEERKQLTAAALTKAREQVTVELRDKEQQLTDVQSKLKAAQDAELALRQERHKLQEDRDTLELTLTRRLDEERSKIRETAKKEADEDRRLKDAEKDSLINTLRTQIEDLRRKSEQGPSSFRAKSSKSLSKNCSAGTFHSTRSPRSQREFTAVTSFRPSAMQRALLQDKFSGNPNEQRTGAMAGCRSFEMTNGRRKPRLRFS